MSQVVDQVGEELAEKDNDDAADEAADGFDWDAIHARLEQGQRAVDDTLERSDHDLDRILAERARALAVPIAGDETSAVDAVEVLGFRSGGESYAVASHHVVEVRIAEEPVPVPQTPPFLLGVANLAGRVLAVIDIPTLLGSVSVPDGAWSRWVVLEASGVMFAAAAEDVDGLFMTSPAPGAANRGGLVRGVSSEMVALLDLEALVIDERFVVDTGTSRVTAKFAGSSGPTDAADLDSSG